MTWDSSTQTNAYYAIYYGSESRTYTNAFYTGTSRSITIPTLPHVPYYFAVVAIDPITTLESDYSQELYYNPGLLRLRVAQSSDLSTWIPIYETNVVTDQGQTFFKLELVR